MKVIILAGGRGTRFAEETSLRPKPMIEIGGIPILEHIMCIYTAHGFNDFLIACGYKSEVIKRYFATYRARHSSWRLHLQAGRKKTLHTHVPDWKISLVETGLHTMTGGRIRRLREWVEDSTFMATYGDGVADIHLHELLAFHRSHGRLATLTATRPPARFGCLEIVDGCVAEFIEKPQTNVGWINGGFFVFEPGIFDYLADDGTVLEKEPLERLARDGQLMAYCHPGFWQPMDTLRDKQLLEELWNSSRAPWKVWSDSHEHVRVLPRTSGTGDRDDGFQGPLARHVA
jgi:glucose-1-phosphate cytidylyltransferase